MILEPVWMALQLLLLVAGSVVVVGFMAKLTRRMPMPSLMGVVVWSAIVFVVTLLGWLFWNYIGGPTFAVVEVAGARWPLGVLTSFALGSAIITGWLARKLGFRRPPPPAPPGPPAPPMGRREAGRSEPPPGLDVA